MDLKIFDRMESEVRGYCRSFPAMFSTAKGAWMTDDKGQRHLDFFSGAGDVAVVVAGQDLFANIITTPTLVTVTET